MNRMKNKILCGHIVNDVFVSFEPTQCDIAKVLKQQSCWMTCAEIADMIENVTAKQVYYHLNKILGLPGGNQAIEVQKSDAFKPNKYRYIK